MILPDHFAGPQVDPGNDAVLGQTKPVTSRAVDVHVDAESQHLAFRQATGRGGTCRRRWLAASETTGSVTPTIKARMATTLAMTAIPPGVMTHRASVSRRLAFRVEAVFSVDMRSLPSPTGRGTEGEGSNGRAQRVRLRILCRLLSP